MTSLSIVSRIAFLAQHPASLGVALNRKIERPNLHVLAEQQEYLPRFVADSPIAMRYLTLLGPLAWDQFPERNLNWPTPTIVVPYAAFVAACLVKLDQGLASLGRLRTFLVEHPALIWLLGFPLQPSRSSPWKFVPEASLPTPRHLTRLLRKIDNAYLQRLLDSSVSLLQSELADAGVQLGQCVSVDTKHILAWVKENNPKTTLHHARFDKNQQPKGDPDCRLGCKRRHNKQLTNQDVPPTPLREPLPARTVSVGEYYWGYASGVVATKIDGWGEFVLAELTQPFDRSDVSYFFPLMADVERRLGFRPPFGALDAAFDAFYVYEYFHQAGGFAAVPWSGRSDHHKQFDKDGLPLCPAGLSMPLKSTFMKRSHCLFPHEYGRYVCPLLFPEVSGESCPVAHKNWRKKGCITTLPLSPGVRIRHELDRQSDSYKEVYRQRSATERINSQAVALGIERPKLRNGQAITNINTLIYVLINLRALQRLRQMKKSRRAEVA